MESIVIYQTSDGQSKVDVRIDKDTIWLNQQQIANLFNVKQPAISKHLKNIFNSGELEEDSVHSILEYTAQDGKDYKTLFYNLDAILSIGYRVNSKNATQFRIWATQTLKKYIVDGYAINEKRLKEKDIELKSIKSAISLLDRSIKNQIENIEQAKHLSEILSDFAGGLSLLDDYDHENLDTKGKTNQEAKRIGTKDFLNVINGMRPKFASDVFAVPKDESFESSVNQIYQTIGNDDCYPTIEEKAAMLL